MEEEELKETIKIEELLNQKNAEDYIFNKSPMLLDKTKSWWIWSHYKKKWVIVDDIDVLINIDNLIMLKEEIYKQHVKRALLNLLEMICRRKYKAISEIEDIGKDEDVANNGYVCFKNSIRKVGVDKCFENDHRYFIKSTIPYNYLNQEEIECPKFDKIFEEWVGKENKLLLYQIVGYCMLDGYPIHVLFCLNGGGRNGKSTFLKVIEKSIGKDNVLTSSLDQILHNRFETSRLYGKLACLMGETNFNLLKDTDVLKKITGDDAIRGEYKMKETFDFMNRAKIIIATNSIPITLDRTDGFYSRWIILDFPNKFESKGDILYNIESTEWELFVNKCYKEIEKVIKDGKFYNQGSIEDRKKRFEERSNPINSFLEQYYIKDINGKVSIYDFYEEVMAYFDKNNYRKISKQAVTEYLTTEYSVEKEKINEYDEYTKQNRVKWVYVGLRKKEVIKDKYTFSEMVNYLRFKYKETEDKSDIEIIKKHKIQGSIYEPISGTFKLVERCDIVD